MPRKYSMDRRNATVDETRQRIVDATVELHNEQGVMATSMQDIAARAGVALGTVYRHFPSLDELVPACGSRNLEIAPPPTSSVFEGLETAEARLTALIAALYVHYEAAQRPYAIGFAEAPYLPVMQGQMDRLDAYMRQIVAEALAPIQPDERVLGTALALADFHTWRAFHRAGFSSEAAAEVVTEILGAHLFAGRSRP